MHRPSIKMAIALMFCTILVSAMTGCQCCSLTDCYSDKIDDISDYGFCMDSCYHPSCDLSRIGHSDWEQCELNRIWCRKCRDKSECE